MSFPETIWTAIDDARAQGDGLSRRRLGEFLSQYRDPIFRFIVARGRTVADAEDLTQEFMVRVWERDLLLHADADRGRLRTFLLALLTRFLSDRGPRRKRRQDAFESRMQTTDVDDHAIAETGPKNPATDAEETFMRNWARSVVRLVHDRTRSHFVRQGRPEWYDIFLASFSSPEATQEALAHQFQKSRDQIRYAVEKSKGQFLEQLRESIAEQIRDPAQVDEEMREVLRLAALAEDDAD